MSSIVPMDTCILRSGSCKDDTTFPHASGAQWQFLSGSSRGADGWRLWGSLPVVHKQEASREDQMEKPTVKVSHYEVCLTTFPNSQSRKDLPQQSMRLLAM